MMSMGVVSGGSEGQFGGLTVENGTFCRCTELNEDPNSLETEG